MGAISTSDTIEEEDERRADENIDPTATRRDDIEDALPDDFSPRAKQEFGEAIYQRRKEVRESVDLNNRMSPNPSNGQEQLRGPDGGFGPMVSSVIDTEVHEDGSYVAKLDPASNYAQKHGTTDFTIDKVDLNAGTEGRRRANW